MSNAQLSTPISEPVEADRNVAVPRDEVFEVLSNERRRYALYFLEQRADEGPVDLRELVDQVAAWENDTSIERLDSGDRKCVYTALRQSHLPKLDQHGIVDYDNLRGEVTLTERAHEVQQYLEYTPESDTTWSWYYLGLSGLCAVLAGAVWFEVAPFDGFSGLTLSLLFVGVFVTVSIAHAYHTHKSCLDRLPSIE